MAYLVSHGPIMPSLLSVLIAQTDNERRSPPVSLSATQNDFVLHLAPPLSTRDVLNIAGRYSVCRQPISALASLSVCRSV